MAVRIHRDVALSFVDIAPVLACRSPARRIVNLVSRNCLRASIHSLAHSFLDRNKAVVNTWTTSTPPPISEQSELQIRVHSSLEKKVFLRSKREQATQSSDQYTNPIFKKSHTAIKLSCTLTHYILSPSTCVRLSAAASSPPFTKCPMNQPP